MKVPGLIPSTLAFSLATFVLSALTSAAQAERPNVIVIMSDDQGGGDYGFMGNEIIRTPELDVMAKRSGLLTKFYVSPVCAPVSYTHLTLPTILLV